ncbi:Uncharacterized protein SCF082_LOCUS7371 [Durusdinium trenchii]|uniref:Uncharacterized protein n=1 Tax=Durusdinium trenchii TaxID=1381693 RepID=A0ABP0IM68_9DINO
MSSGETQYDVDDDLFWTPPEGIPGHAGTPIPSDLDFFEPPPEEIGEIVSAWSSLSTDKEPMGPTLRWILAFVIGVGGWLGGTLLFRMFDVRDDFAANALGGLIGVIGLLVVLAAEKLFTSQTRHYYNGVYTGTSYDYRWADVGNRTQFQLKGTYQAKDGNPKPKDPFHLAMSAEMAWSQYLLDGMQEELEREGCVEFPVNKSDLVRVGPGFLEFVLKGAPTRVEAADIKELSISDGTFNIKTHDAKWFGSKGKYRFNYGRMGNAKLFVFSLERLLGVRFG